MGRPFSTFFADNYSLAVSVAEHRLQSLHDAEEVATEAFRIAWSRFEEGEQVTVPWLYGVLRNLIGNEYRSRERRAALHERIGDDLALSAPEPVDPYSDVRDAVERLPPEQREILLMAYWDELTGPEIALVLGINHTAVRTRLMRARRTLRSRLSEAARRTGAEVTRP